MIEFIMFDQEGRITSEYSVANWSEVYLNTTLKPQRGWCLGKGGDDLYVDVTEDIHYLDARPRQRPVVSVMEGATYDLSLLPEGSRLIITDPIGYVTEIEAQADTLELIDAGTYKVRSESPFPHMDFSTEVTV